MKTMNDLQAGKAGEYLVCADLILQGHIAYPSEQGLHYDVVADCGRGLIRIQVKATRNWRATPQRKKQVLSYLFNARRYGKNGRGRYEGHEFDIMAFVALEDRLVWYLPASSVQTTMQFRTKNLKYANENGRYLEDCTLEKALECGKS